MRNQDNILNKNKDIIVIGSGMGSLSAASLLAAEGRKVSVLEQNYLPGGCTSAYFRKGFIFEAGATTLVGLDEGMPLKYILDKTGIQLDAVELDIPMRVYLRNGEVLTRYKNLDKWIAEAERVFGVKGQRAFWEYCYKVSQFVWQTSLQQRVFPPSRFSDLLPMLQNFRFKQIGFAGLAFTSMKSLLKRFGLLYNTEFVAFVDEQLLITAQNTHTEVNVLFGATALCYTNYGNYYVWGGLINLVKPFCEYIKQQGGEVLTRTSVERVKRNEAGQYKVYTNKGRMECQQVISGLPISNTLALFDDEALNKKYKKKIMGSAQLNSAFQMGIAFRDVEAYDNKTCLHHQIHLDEPLPFTGSKSIFLSLSHPLDWYRAPLGQRVASISTHSPNPGVLSDYDKSVCEDIIIKTLVRKGFFEAKDIIYQHSSTPVSWQSWTKRTDGFVGGYPQYFSIKPWEMIDSRLDGKGAYICGDTTYPGQGIPGTALSGIIAVEKLKRD